jgi:aminoglycoside 3-N-acetyltransferase I
LDGTIKNHGADGIGEDGGLPVREIRLLGAGDVGLMYELLTVFGEAFDEVETYGAARPGRAYLQRLLAGDTFIALVALVDGAVVGGLAGYALPKFERERTEIFIYDLAVTAAHRRQGIATALLVEMKRIASARGAWVVFIQADAGDEPAIALYEKLGTREDAAHFDIPVDGPDPEAPR